MAVAPCADAATPEGERALKALLAKLERGPTQLTSVLNSYGSLESARRLDPFDRFEIHEALRGAVAKAGYAALGSEVERYLRRSSRSSFPGKVLLLKAASSKGFNAELSWRLGILIEAAQGKEDALSIWGARLLGDMDAPEAVDALIATLAREESEGRGSGLRASVLSIELYRVLGSAAAQPISDAIRVKWERMGKKIPKAPDYGDKEQKEFTTSFFGDRISPRSIFCIDTSSSMLEETTLGSGTTTATGATKKGKSDESEPKIEIVKRELARCVEGLLPECSFNIVSYSRDLRIWRAGSRLALQDATRSSIEAAAGFARGLEARTGTNIHDAMARALDVPDVETVYLLSDGVPSVGGDQKAVLRRVAAMNYLQGTRVITYGFQAQGAGAYDEAFMRQLAQQNWGWYRRLN